MSYAPQRDFAGAGIEGWVDPDSASDSLPLEGRGRDDQKRFPPPRASPCRDWGWILLWIAQLVVVIGVGYSCYHKYSAEISHPSAAALSSRSGSTPPPLNGAAFSILGACIGVSVGLSFLYLGLMKKFPREMIWVSLVMMIPLWFVLSIWCFSKRNWIGGVVCGLLVPLQCVWIYVIQNRIPFAEACIRVSMRAVDKVFGSLCVVALGAMMLQIAWFLLWLVAAVAILFSMNVDFEAGKPGTTEGGGARHALNARVIFALFGLLLSFFWTSQILKNIVHVTVSGVVGVWYFLYPLAMPPGNPVWASLRRACTTSFGSIVLGSLVTATVKALRTTFHLVSHWLRSDHDTNCFTLVGLCMIDCLLGIIEAMVEWINVYAYTYMALYGGDYFESAKKSFALMTSRGIDAVVNDDLVSTVLVVGVLGIGGLCAGLAPLLAAQVFTTAGDWRMWVVIGLVLGITVAVTILSIVESAVITLFVALADDPVVLRQTKQEEYEMLVPLMRLDYPEVDLDTNPGGAAAAGADGNRMRGANRV